MDQSDQGREFKTRIANKSAALQILINAIASSSTESRLGRRIAAAALPFGWSEQFRSAGELPLRVKARHSVLREGAGLRPLFWWRKARCEH